MQTPSTHHSMASASIFINEIWRLHDLHLVASLQLHGYDVGAAAPFRVSTTSSGETFSTVIALAEAAEICEVFSAMASCASQMR
jgi:hypothetical protein